MKEISTKDKILASARKLFVEHGFDGASIADIAKEAGVNHSLVFHHFGNKETLWLAVKQNIVDDANKRVRNLPDTDLPFKEFLKKLFVRSINFYHSNPDIIRMMNWQRLESKTDQIIGVTLSPEMQSWIDAFTYYQKKGELNSKLKPEFVITLVLSVISSIALDPNIFISNEKRQKEYITFCLQVLLKGLDTEVN